MSRVAVITGTGIPALRGLVDAVEEPVATPYGEVVVTRGRLAEVEVLHVSRHGRGHARLSNHVRHRANVWALRERAPVAAIGLTACGALDPTVRLGTWLVFDDLWFPSNRLPDGGLATLYDQPGDPGRGHWIFETPYATEVRGALVQAAAEIGAPVRDGGLYGHVDGPRYNTRAEIRRLQQLGVTAVSQTGGPETVLCGEAELPYALIGFPTDHATGVLAEPTSFEEVRALSAAHADAAAALLGRALPALAGTRPAPPGSVYRYERP